MNVCGIYKYIYMCCYYINNLFFPSFFFPFCRSIKISALFIISSFVFFFFVYNKEKSSKGKQTNLYPFSRMNVYYKYRAHTYNNRTRIVWFFYLSTQ